MFFFFKQKTAYEIPSSDWSSDVCSSDLDSTEGGRKVYALTDQGRAELTSRAEEIAGLEAEIRESVSTLAAEIREDVRGAAGDLRREVRAAAQQARARPGGSGTGSDAGTGSGQEDGRASCRERVLLGV